MDCPECDEPLDISATKPQFLRCCDCLLIFVVKDSGLQGLSVQAPPGLDQEEFFASMTANLGFEDDDERAARTGRPSSRLPPTGTS